MRWPTSSPSDTRRGTFRPGPLLVDTDVLSWIALGEGRANEFAALLLGHELLVCFVAVAEVRTFLRMGVLATERAEGLRAGLADYALLSVRLGDVITEWVRLRAATVQTGNADDRERRQNDTWIAVCALSVEPPLPVVTGNLRDFTGLASVSSLLLVHPDL
ncbi:MAG: PIN domain-containing protein [Acidimicrobiales bacterium]